MELEFAGLQVEDAGAGDVPRQQIGRALETAEGTAQGLGQRALASRVLVVPGTSSRRRCPSANRQVRTSWRIGR